MLAFGAAMAGKFWRRVNGDDRRRDPLAVPRLALLIEILPSPSLLLPRPPLTPRSNTSSILPRRSFGRGTRDAPARSEFQSVVLGGRKPLARRSIHRAGLRISLWPKRIKPCQESTTLGAAISSRPRSRCGGAMGVSALKFDKIFAQSTGGGLPACRSIRPSDQQAVICCTTRKCSPPAPEYGLGEPECQCRCGGGGRQS